MDSECITTVKLTEAEISHIIWGMTAIKTIRLPLDPEWKNPYIRLLDDFKKIQENIKQEKQNLEVSNGSSRIKEE